MNRGKAETENRKRETQRTQKAGSRKQKDVVKKCWKCGKIYKNEDAFDVCECEKCGCVMFKVLDKKPGVAERVKDKFEQMKIFGG